MKRRLLFLFVALSLVLVAAAPFAASARANAPRTRTIEGTWTAIDVFDGSRMRLWIRADKDIASLYELRYFDQACGACAGLPGAGRFVAFMDDNGSLYGIGFFRSQGHTYFYQVSGKWTYDPTTDTVTEDVGHGTQVWFRAGAN